ncbi:hypothetical protein [Kribbella sp. NPDC051718]|uniref:hypothetical protein n=1 Tax=Kribbella sp. NPDC051718 TaxID=3155168 RepID=UPI0034324E62
MKKLLLSGVAVVGAVLSPLAVAAPANAAPAPQARTVQTSTDSTLGFWADVAYFATMGDCIGAGEFGRARGTWSAYNCNVVPRKGVLLRAFYN